LGSLPRDGPLRASCKTRGRGVAPRPDDRRLLAGEPGRIGSFGRRRGRRGGVRWRLLGPGRPAAAQEQEDTARLISTGPGDNLNARVFYHLTRNADDTVTAEFVHAEVACRG
jgi:hypothetical protein